MCGEKGLDVEANEMKQLDKVIYFGMTEVKPNFRNGTPNSCTAILRAVAGVPDEDCYQRSRGGQDSPRPIEASFAQ